MVSQIDDSLEDGGIVLGVRIDDTFLGCICLCFIHLLLDVHDLLEYFRDICFRMFNGVEQFVGLFHSI